MVDDERWLVEQAIETALIETHHLANISGVEEADRARDRLVEAQSASSHRLTRDHLQDACEYLELARLLRRDCADGFTDARDRIARAEAALRFERPIPGDAPVEALLDPGPRRDRSLADIREQAAVGSFEQVRRDVALEEAFADVRRTAGADEGAGGDATGGGDTHGDAGGDGDTRDGAEVDPVDGSGDGDASGAATGDEGEAGTGTVGEASEARQSGGDDRTPAPGGGGDLGVEEALRAASLEVNIERALLRAADSTNESEFEFVSSDQLVSPDGGAAGGP